MDIVDVMVMFKVFKLLFKSKLSEVESIVCKGILKLLKVLK